MTRLESTLKITRTFRSEQVLIACVEPVRKSLPLDLKKTWITADDIDFRSYPAYLQDFRRIGIERVQVLA